MSNKVTPTGWFKSTYSNNGGECVEINLDDPEIVLVRDSKNPAGPAHRFTNPEWDAFLLGAKEGQFNRR
jgi:hypothetical protein